MRRALLILAFAALILLGSVVTGPGKTRGNIALTANPMQYIPSPPTWTFQGFSSAASGAAVHREPES
jgi:hypothetical protein